MRKSLLVVFTLILVLVFPASSFAAESNEALPDQFTSEFLLVEKEQNNPDVVSTQATPKPAGYGTILCKAIGSGKMECNWTIKITKSGEAIQKAALVFVIDNFDGKEVGRRNTTVEPLGTNYNTLRGQETFNPGKGKFKVYKYGAVEGRKAIYEIVAVTADVIEVK
ncbi:hypothetical protein C0Q44_19345 [Paenibacillus sp. PCH8]|uniref:hypothetical protein n=1 Tax=Paenibacillus sp. PCH8 TaxID=2066524 RepID=UPI000CF8B1F8|nr:hypothetical protein [Paenibacillus sp. PCH8]PQP81834.1 hypothetical protein C0Q44_19345 [Paenibacillus sp. PCH8]